MQIQRHIRTILLVDDAPEDRHLIATLLNTQPNMLYTFLHADSAAKGLELLEQAHVDCVFLDYHLPDMNGREFLHSMSSQARETRPPVIMVTGMGNEYIAAGAFRAGVVNYIAKDNLATHALCDILQNALDQASRRRRRVQRVQEDADVASRFRQTEDRYRMLVESIEAYAVLLVGSDGRISTWNGGARQLFDLHDHEIIGQNVRQLYIKEGDQQRKVERDFAKASRVPQTYRRRDLMRRDGSIVSCRVAISPVFDASVHLRGYAWVACVNA